MTSQFNFSAYDHEANQIICLEYKKHSKTTLFCKDQVSLPLSSLIRLLMELHLDQHTDHSLLYDQCQKPAPLDSMINEQMTLE